MAATSAPTDLEGLGRLRDIVISQTDQTKVLIEGLFKQIEDLTDKLADTTYELEDKRDAARAVRSKLAEAKNQLDELKRGKDRHAFAALLIDGDSVLFNNGFVEQGMEGGKKAASLLKQAVEENLRLDDSGPIHHLQVVIRVYANVRGLAKTYKQLGILSDISLFDDFVRGLNMGYSLCDYVDAGNGKECSDEKVKAMFKMYFDDMHCRHIVFGGSADNGYARMLEPYLQSDADRAKITLLEGPPFAPELARIKDRFRTLSFPNILRDQKLPAARLVAAPAPSPPSTSTSSWTSAASKQSTVTTVSSAPTFDLKPTSRKAEPVIGVVGFNARDERVDIPLVYSKQMFNDIRVLKLCNHFHLSGYCGNKGCTHEHGEKLGAKQMAALRAIARTAPCSWGLECDDSDCISGHMCTKPNCIRERCWFSKAMHDVDTKIVKRIGP